MRAPGRSGPSRGGGGDHFARRRPRAPLLVFALGLALGGALVAWLLRPGGPPGRSPEPPAEPARETPARDAPSSPSRALGQISARTADGRERGWADAALVGNPPVLVAPSDVLAGATEVVAFLSDGPPGGTPLARVLAATPDLVAFEPPPGAAAGLTLDPEDYPLYLGRDLLVPGPGGGQPASVDGGPGARGGTVPVRVGPSGARAGAPLLDPTSGRMLGILTGPADPGDRAPAADATAVRALLEAATAEAGAPTAALLARLAAQPEARWQAVVEDARAGRLEAALEGGLSLVSAAPEYRSQAAPLLSRAAAALAEAALAHAEPRAALTWLEKTHALVPPDAAWLERYAAAYEALGEHGHAREALERVVALEPGRAPALRDRLRRATLAEADGRLQAGDTGGALAVLARAAREDPTHAAYHQRLGMTYLALGDGARALESLERAVGLDPALAEVVGGLVADLRGRAGVEGAVAVPLERRLGVLYVTVRVNGHPAPLRMVLDTGASHTALTRRSATLLGLGPGPGTPQLWVDTVSERVPAFLVTLEEVEVGGVVARDVPALVLESVDDGDGLLGLSFLRHFNVEVRERSGTLVLSPR